MNNCNHKSFNGGIGAMKLLPECLKESCVSIHEGKSRVVEERGGRWTTKTKI